jgi:hypothetical protein
MIDLMHGDCLERMRDQGYFDIAERRIQEALGGTGSEETYIKGRAQ